VSVEKMQLLDCLLFQPKSHDTAAINTGQTGGQFGWFELCRFLRADTLMIVGQYRKGADGVSRPRRLPERIVWWAILHTHVVAVNYL